MDCSLPGSSVHGDSPGKNTGVGCHFLFQGIFPTQGTNPGLPHCRKMLYHLSHQGTSRHPKHLLISWLQSPSAVILERPKIKSDTVSTVSPSISYEVMGPDAIVLVLWMLSFKPTFSLSSVTVLKRHFSSSSLSAIRVVSSEYLRLLIFLLAILIPTCASSSPVFSWCTLHIR